MGNKATGGPFAPLVVVTRNVIGDKDFNKFRGKAIAAHSQGVLAQLLCASAVALGGAGYRLQCASDCAGADELCGLSHLATIRCVVSEHAW